MIVTAAAEPWERLDEAPGGSAAPSAGKTVFVFEDSAILSTAILDMLHDEGFAAESFTGPEGVECVAAGRPLMVVLDVQLFQSDAVDVLQRLAEIGYDGLIQLMSGVHSGLLARVKEVGERRGMTMLPVLQKPFALSELRAIVESEARSVAARSRPSTQAAGALSRDSVPLRLALDEGWIEVWYQPKYDLLTRTLSGAECLCRLRHPDHGIMGPGAFLHDTELDDMRRLTEFVLARACSDWALFKDAGHGLRLAINIPCALLTTMPLARLLRQWSPQAADWPGLVLEVTEEQALHDIATAHEIGTQLQIYGTDLSIDDFGTGYSSLARLREIPFKEIKLDRTLVDGCAGDITRAALCRAIIDLSRTLGARTVAEGIERQEDLDCLRDAGCDVGQGFLLGRPMTREMLAFEILNEGRITLSAGAEIPSEAASGRAAPAGGRRGPLIARRPDPARADRRVSRRDKREGTAAPSDMRRFRRQQPLPPGAPK